MKYIKNNWHKAALLIILFAAGFLSFYDIGKEGYANQYYSAAVRSMLTSWHNFFYASFDAGGYVTVDKPALGLWLQAISAFIFGFHGWSLILPQALSTVVSVGLIYHLVQRFFGKMAGIISALILVSSAYAFADTGIVRSIIATVGGVNLVVDGVQMTPKDANGKTISPIAFEGTTYVPIRFVTNVFNKKVSIPLNYSIF
jgi:4-amino-4-deoxy-L-arabinose transferase-like glycosyltransferase